MRSLSTNMKISIYVHKKVLRILEDGKVINTKVKLSFISNEVRGAYEKNVTPKTLSCLKNR